MEETAEEPKKGRGWPKGKARGPRKAVAPEAAPPEAPIHVVVTRKGMDPFEFGCAQHFTENGFHVFLYPSRRDPYRQTRREIAISEVIDIEITAARQQPYEFTVERPSVIAGPIPGAPQGPKIHSAKQSALAMMKDLETTSGSVKMDTMPRISFGDSAG